jgi:hypothetical protein
VNFKDQFHARRIPESEAAWYLWVLRLGLGGGVATSEREVSAPNGGTPRVGRKTSSDAEGTGVISPMAVSGGGRPAHFYETPTRRTIGARDL